MMGAGGLGCWATTILGPWDWDSSISYMPISSFAVHTWGTDQTFNPFGGGDFIISGTGYLDSQD